MSGKLKWGIIAAGRIARTFAQALAESATGELVAIGSRSRESAERFGDEFGVKYRYPTYASLLENSEVEAVYISPLHPMHAEWAIKAAEAGKHILCEKPLTMNYKEAAAVVDAARAHDVFLMEAFMYRCHPQTQKIVDLIREGAIGDVRVIQATFSFHAEPVADSRILEHHLGGGGILDVGCYCASMTRLIAGVAVGQDFAEPVEFSAYGHIGETSRVDEYTVATAKFPGDIVAQLATGVLVEQESVVRVYGTEGHLYIPEPWVPGPKGQPTYVHLHKKGEDKGEKITIEADRGLFTIEADLVAEHLGNRQAPPPAMTWDDTLGNMRMLDLWRGAVGLVYDFE